MKKIVYSLLIVFGIVLLTGCGKEVDFSKLNHVTCTKTEAKASDTTTLFYGEKPIKQSNYLPFLTNNDCFYIKEYEIKNGMPVFTLEKYD